MEREGKGGKERKEKKEDEEEEVLFGVRLKRGVYVGKRGGNSTPSPTWRYGLAQFDGSLVKDFNFTSNHTSSLSVRKLGANLWEFQPHFTVKMNQNGPSQLPTPSDKPSEDLRRHVAAFKKQHNQSVAENDDVVLCESPASCSSSMEMAPYRPAVIPAKMGTDNRIGKSSYNLKTSTELLKVLNRIWSLEEQHASHVLLVKALKREIDHSKTQIKELQQEKKLNMQEISELMNRVAEDSKIEEAVKTLRDELEDERKLRKHSENLHRKLARELSEVKSSFSIALRELKRERKARAMLEDLCDEFAKEIKEYEQEVRTLKCTSKRDQMFGDQHSDKSILHISEAWLDERMQMKAADTSDIADEKTISGRLGVEIEEFLRARKSGNSRSNKSNRSALNRHSLESFHLEDDGSAPRNDHLEETTQPNPTIRRTQSLELTPKVQSLEKIHEDAKDLDKPKAFRVHSQKRKSKQHHIRSSLLNSLIRNHRLSRGAKKHETTENQTEHSFDPSRFTGPESPVEKWTSEKTGQESALLPEPSADSTKENTLKAKLLEARLECQQHHPLRAS